MRKNSAGFTLVETVIALSVTSLLIFVVINFMTNSIVGYAQAGTRTTLLSEAQTGIDVIANDIRISGNADSANRWQDNNAPGAPGNLFSWSTGNGTLILATAVEDANGNIVFADPVEYISEKNNNIYFVSNRTLYKRTLAAPNVSNKTKTSCPASVATASCPADRVILKNVETFTVKYYNDQNQEVAPANARSVDLYVKLQKSEYKQPVSVEYSTRMVFRND